MHRVVPLIVRPRMVQWHKVLCWRVEPARTGVEVHVARRPTRIMHVIWVGTVVVIWDIKRRTTVTRIVRLLEISVVPEWRLVWHKAWMLEVGRLAEKILVLLGRKLLALEAFVLVYLTFKLLIRSLLLFLPTSLSPAKCFTISKRCYLAYFYLTEQSRCKNLPESGHGSYLLSNEKT